MCDLVSHGSPPLLPSQSFSHYLATIPPDTYSLFFLSFFLFSPFFKLENCKLRSHVGSNEIEHVSVGRRVSKTRFYNRRNECVPLRMKLHQDAASLNVNNTGGIGIRGPPSRCNISPDSRRILRYPQAAA